MAIDTLYTSAGYNAFATEEQMDAIMVDLGVTFTATFWASLDTPNKEALIKASTRYINTMEWLGDQNPDIAVASMDWPRIDLDGAEDTVVPEEIMLRMGCWIIHNATANGNGSGNGKADGVTNKSVGDVSLTYETRAESIEATNLAIDPCATYAKDFLADSELSFGIGGVGKKRRP